MSKFIIKKIESEKELNLSQKIREIVFCDEQKVSKEIEFDGLDDLCDHFLIFKKNNPIGTARLREKTPGIFKIERVAVLKKERLNGAGKLLMNEVIKHGLNNHSLKLLILHSQVQVKSFYKKLGFKEEGKEFFEDGIPHIKMIFEIELKNELFK
jgi:Predicted acyltransferase